MRACGWLSGLLTVLVISPGGAEISIWQLGGSGLAWSEHDTNQVFVDFAAISGALQPRYLIGERNLLPQLDNWSPLKFPRELDYVDGSRPRIWVAADGFFWFQRAGLLVDLWVDGDSTSYVPPGSLSAESDWYTIDIGVPVPADQFGFFTPPRGFTGDGRPLREDVFDAFEVSISEETDPVLSKERTDRDYHPLETVIAYRPQNFDPAVKIDFPKQYVRFIRFKRLITDRTRGSGVRLGTIGDFELFARGIPKRAFYTTAVIDLGQEVNFGRVSWSATPMRVVDGAAVETPDAQASVKVEMRSGRDEDPNVYHEFTDEGEEVVVLRQRFEQELKPPDSDNSTVVQEGKPGLRASVSHDRENWTYWSFPLAEAGIQAPLERGRYLQVRVTLESQAFADFVRLDSLWLERSPPLAGPVRGEVARLDDPRPTRGFTQVELGKLIDFSYDLKAEFSGADQRGFDAVRIRTGSRPVFRHLELGEPLAEVAPARVAEEEEALVVFLPQRVTGGSNVPMRVVFSTEVFLFANTFTAEVFDTGSEDLPQQVEAGDVSPEVGTNSLQIWGVSGEVGQVIAELRFSSGVMTPNGDGVNDQLAIEYSLFRLPGAVPVELNVYRLDGARVARIEVGRQGAGLQRIFWDGRDGDGHLLWLGIYLVEISLKSERSTIRHLQPVSIVY
ncbi:MAG: hypothetical protein HYW07_21080 [Candidatus Latescibacteria bacterium]|nr:hypothetical protein [Candidatus Latescibacterota bacterium]